VSLINGVNTSAVFASTRDISGTGGSVQNAQNLGRDDFFKLLIAELQNQDPLNPKDDTAFLAELAQFSNLEETRNLAEVNSKLQVFQATTLSASLIGRNVEAQVENPTTGEMETWTGTVEEVRLGGDLPTLLVDGVSVDFANVSRVF